MSAIRMSIRKELRAVAPMWAACMAALAAAARFEVAFLPDFPGLIFVFGCLAIGAQSMGHEYAHRTIGLLLAQPIDRRRILFIKSGVLALALATFCAAAYVMIVPVSNEPLEFGPTPRQAILVTALASLFITPYLTMLCRSGLAGLLFTGGASLIVGMIFSAVFAGSLTANPSAIHPAFFWPGMLVLSGFAAVDTWRVIARLEAREGPGPEFHLPFVTARADGAGGLASTRRHPLMWLLRKELRLQRMSFALAGVWAISLAVMYLRSFYDPRYVDVMVPLAFMALGTIPLVTGAVASAEERHLGTLEWQVLLPLAAWRQWTVKAGVVIGLSLLLAIGIPAIALGAAGESGSLGDWINAGLVVAVIAITALYVSSLTTSAIRAVVVAVFILTAATVLIPWMLFVVSRSLIPVAAALRWSIPLALVFVTLPLLEFGFRNHRSAERPVDQLRRQLGWIAAAVVVLMLIAV